MCRCADVEICNGNLFTVIMDPRVFETEIAFIRVPTCDDENERDRAMAGAIIFSFAETNLCLVAYICKSTRNFY